jgi:hypothetical protein
MPSKSLQSINKPAVHNKGKRPEILRLEARKRFFKYPIYPELQKTRGHKDEG